MCTANSFISVPLAIVSLIVDRTRVLDLSRPDLVRRAGYKNSPKVCGGSTSFWPATATRPEI